VSINVNSQNDESWKVFDDSEVAIVKINMEENDLQYMYDNPQSDSMHLVQVSFKNAYINEVIDSVGFRIRGNTSRDSFKKSFKLSFNTFVDKGDFYSLDKINLNGEHNDPSIVRSKLSWDFFNSIGVSSSRAAHTAVYINEKYYGLYISVEHIDDEFLNKNFEDDSGNLWKCLYGSDLVYLGEDPDLYKFESIGGDRPYSLITNEELNDYTQLSRLISVINNSSNEQFEETIEAILDVNSVLKYFATNVAIGGWDDYWSLSNNYYLYFNPTNDKFTLIPYDYDNTFGISFGFGIDWENVDPYTFGQVVNGPRPLVERLLSFPKYRNLYTHFLEYYSNNIFNTNQFFSKLINLRTQIQAYAELDTFRIKDWGFSKQDFLTSFDGADFSYSNGVEVNNSIKGFIVNRTNSINSQISYIEYPPIFYNINLSSTRLQLDEGLTIGASIFSNNHLSSVKVEVKINGEETKYFDLNYNPDVNSPIIENVDKWETTLAPFGNSKIVTIKIIAEDNKGATSSYPEEAITIITGSQVIDKIIINELMSSNTSEIMDDFNEYEDWIEIYNPSDTAVNLSGKYLTDKRDNLTKWEFPQNFIIQPKEYRILWCDEDQVQGYTHTNFRLNSLGEFIAMVDDDGISIIDSVTFPGLNENEVYARESLESSWSKSTTPTPGETNIITGIEKEANIQNEFSLKAYPNPFNPSTKIEYELAKPSDLQLTIFDILGREVWSLEQKNLPKGKHTLYWNGKDNNGKDLVSGIYIVSMNAKIFNKAIKLMLVR
jgi:hypothetical protein